MKERTLPRIRRQLPTKFVRLMTILLIPFSEYWINLRSSEDMYQILVCLSVARGHC